MKSDAKFNVTTEKNWCDTKKFPFMNCSSKEFLADRKKKKKIRNKRLCDHKSMLAIELISFSSLTRTGIIMDFQ